MKKLTKILVANRGEIALRIMRSAREMGIKTVAIYSEVDRRAPHVLFADEAVCIGPAPSSESYLKGAEIVRIAKELGVDGIHPGYGFLSENAGFATLVEAAGITFIGPRQHAIEIMGDKLSAKDAVKDFDVPLVPGSEGEVQDPAEALKIAEEIGFPVMIKASAGGGGKGMRIAYNDHQALEGFRLSKEEAISSFGDGRIFIEKYIEAPRHIEFQILGDEHGNYVYLPERECSVQRRNQKVIEEAPSSAMDQATRHRMGSQALDLARACGYFSTGTVEFLMDDNKDFYFLEMNTRLQVEHPITEEITGVDLVEQQIMIAAGHKLRFTQDDVKINGHSMEYRVYAEDPARKFLPSIGFLRRYKEPTKYNEPERRVRIDTGVEEGSEISMYYDPMISKLISWGPTRKEASKILDRAFDEYVIQGVTHNLGFGKSILANKAYADGEYSTAFIPTYYKDGFTGDYLTDQDHTLLSVAAHQIKNIHLGRGEFDPTSKHEKTFYVTIDEIRDQPQVELKVEQLDDTKYRVTDLKENKHLDVDMSNFDIQGDSLITFNMDGEEQIMQFLDN